MGSEEIDLDDVERESSFQENWHKRETATCYIGFTNRLFNQSGEE